MGNFFSQDQIDENSLYDANTKSQFLADDQAIMDAFLYNFVGALAAYEAAIKKDKILKHFKSDLKVKVDNITDDNHDISLIIKVMHDKGFFKTPTTVTNITRFLAKLKLGGVDSIDVNIVKEWINAVKPDAMKNASKRLKALKDDLVDNGDLVFYAHQMRANMRKFDTSGEFMQIVRNVTFKKSDRKKLSDPVPGKASDGSAGTVDNSNPTDSSATTVAGVGTTVAPDSQADQVDPVQSAQPVRKGKLRIDTVAEVDEFLRDVFRNDLDISNFKDKFTLTPEAKKYILRKYQYSGIIQSSDLDKFAHECNKMVELAPNLNKGQLNNIASAMNSKFTRRFVLLPSKPDIIGHLEKLTAIAKMGPAIDFLLEHGFVVMDETIQLLRKVCRDIFTEDPTLANKSAYSPYIKEIKNLEPSNRLSINSLSERLMVVPQLKPAEAAYFGLLFLDDKHATKQLIVKAGGNQISSVGDRTVFTVRKLDGWSAADNWDPWQHEITAKLMDELNIHKPSVVDAIVVNLTNPSISSRVSLDQHFQNNHAEFLEAIDEAVEKDFSETYKNVFRALTKQWSRDPVVQDKIHNAALKNLDKQPVINAGIQILFEKMSGPIYDLEAVQDPIFSKLTIAPVRAAAKYILDNFDSFADNNLIGWSAAKITNSIQELIVRKSHGAGVPDFPAKFARLWFDKVAKAFEQYQVKSSYNDIMQIYGFRLDLLSPPGDILAYISNAELDKLRIAGMKMLHSEGGYQVNFVMDLAGQRGNLKYSEMGEKVKEYVDEFLQDLKDNYRNRYTDVVISFASSTDAEFYEKHTKELIPHLPVGPFVRFVKAADDDLKNTAIKDFFADNKNIDKMIENPEAIEAFLVINEHTDVLEKHATDMVRNAVKHTIRDPYKTSIILSDITGDNSSRFSKLTKEHRKIALEEALTIIDDKSIMSKNSTDYRESMPAVKVAMNNMIEEDRALAQNLYDNMSNSMKRHIAADYMQRQGFIIDAQSALTTQTADNPIIAYEKLSPKRIKEILKYNNVTTAESSLKMKDIKDFDTMEAYVQSNNDVPFEKLHVEEIEMTEEEKLKQTALYHKTKRNNKHGRNGMKILRSFNVAIPMQIEAQEKWNAEHPTQEIINPMFHGTGSVAAAMILRYGFRVIKSGDASVVGRMLGDGVYAAIHIDKAQQYVGDSGFTRRAGTKGYIFEINGALGEEDKDYKVAGLGRDTIRSPEWCVFTPNSQYRIFRAHEVELVDPYEIELITKVHGPVNEEESIEFEKGMKFSTFINEERAVKENYTTYTFVNGVIPVSDGKNVDFEDFKPNNKNVTLEPSAYGPTVVVRGTKQSNDYMFTSATDLISNHPELFRKYLKQIK